MEKGRREVVVAKLLIVHIKYKTTGNAKYLKPAFRWLHMEPTPETGETNVCVLCVDRPHFSGDQ